MTLPRALLLSFAAATAAVGATTATAAELYATDPRPTVVTTPRPVLTPAITPAPTPVVTPTILIRPPDECLGCGMG